MTVGLVFVATMFYHIYVHYICAFRMGGSVAKARKVTFSLQPDIVAALDEAVRQGAAPSKNGLVERALRKEISELRRQWRAAQWQMAARDPLFLRDIDDVELAFRSADAETARSIE
jgi:hypothetical protein